MAQKKDEPNVGLINTESLDFRTSQVKQKWGSKEEYDTVREVRNRWQEMVTHRRKACYWENGPSRDDVNQVVDEGSESGMSSWSAHWNNCYDAWSMFAKYVEGRSNLKSPISFAPVEAAIAEFQENNVTATLTASNQEDKEKVRILEFVLRHAEKKGDFGAAKATSFKECLITGTSIEYIPYAVKKREVDVILTGKDIEKKIQVLEDEDKKANKKKIKEMQEQLDNKEPLTERQMVTEYNDIARVPVSIYDFWVDDSAECLRGFSHEAVDCIWRTKMSTQQALAEYRNSTDPYVIKKNIDKIKGASEAADGYVTEDQLFKVPWDIDEEKSHTVEVIRYYNKQTDKFIVLINDVLIRKGPLPYNHKELPFVRHIWTEFPHQFYGIGMVAPLLHGQAEDEVIRNMQIEKEKIIENPPIFISTDVYEDIDSQWTRLEPGLKVEVPGDVNNTVRWFEPPRSRADGYRIREDIRSDSVMITGVNPLATSMPNPDEAVRNNVLAMESTLKRLKSGIKNYARGEKEAVRQEIAIIQQMYPLSYIHEVVGDEDPMEKNKQISIEGYKVMENTEGDISIREIDGESTLPIKPEYLQITGDIFVEFDTDVIVPTSKGVQMQKVEKTMQDLIPLLSNPQMLEMPGILELVYWYAETHGVPANVTAHFRDQDSEEEADAAEEQNMMLMKGEPVPGIPGESKIHQWVHQNFLLKLMLERGGIEPVGPETSLQDAQRAQMEMEMLDEIIQNVAMHLETDLTPKDMGPQATLSKLAPPQQAQPGGTGAPMGAPGGGMPGEQVPPEMVQGIGPDQVGGAPLPM